MLTEEQLNELGNEDQQAEEHTQIIEKENNVIEKLQAEVDEQKDKYLRLFAEFDNFKKRTSKERLELIKNASQEMIMELLPIVDDFERAKKISEEQGNESIFPEGMQLVYNKLLHILKNKGVSPMESTGLEFDSTYHEAITEIPTADENMKGKNFDTIEKGYMLYDKIIRYAKVIVNK